MGVAPRNAADNQRTRFGRSSTRLTWTSGISRVAVGDSSESRLHHKESLRVRGCRLEHVFTLGKASVAAHAELGNPQRAGRERRCTRWRGKGNSVGIGSDVRLVGMSYYIASNRLTMSAFTARERCTGKCALTCVRHAKCMFNYAPR